MIIEMGLPMCIHAIFNQDNYCSAHELNVNVLCKKLLMLTNSTNVRDGTVLNT